MNKKYVIAFSIIILLTPLGLLAEGTAWGEWGTEELQEILGFIPQGMQHFPVTWSGIFPDYSVPGLETSFFEHSLGYIGSALVGCGLIGIAFYILQGILKQNKLQHPSSHHKVQ